MFTLLFSRVIAFVVFVVNISSVVFVVSELGFMMLLVVISPEDASVIFVSIGIADVVIVVGIAVVVFVVLVTPYVGSSVVCIGATKHTVIIPIGSTMMLEWRNEVYLHYIQTHQLILSNKHYS